VSTPAEEDGAVERFETAFTESGGAAVAALLHLLRLMAAELVLSRGVDIGQFEAVVRVKIDQFSSPTADPQARAAGLGYARHLVEQVLTQVRAPAELKRGLTAKGRAAPGQRAASDDDPRLLN
jgi:hypothetical protein